MTQKHEKKKKQTHLLSNIYYEDEQIINNISTKI